MRVWIDMTASAHVLVFRPLIRILRERGDEVEITARDYAQTLQLLELHGLAADAVHRLIDDHVAGREDLSRQLWGLLAFTLWHERHVEREPGPARIPEALAA